MGNKKLMTIDEKFKILNKINNIETNLSERKYLKSIENTYLENVYLDREIINRNYPTVIWDVIKIGVDILLDDDLSIQSKEMEILYDYKDFINDNKTKQRNENSDFTSINLDINIDQLIELHNKQLDCVVNICKDVNGEEVITFDEGYSFVLDEDLFDFISSTMKTSFIGQTLKFIRHSI